MTVSELIAKLQALDGNAEICLYMEDAKPFETRGHQLVSITLEEGYTDEGSTPFAYLNFKHYPARPYR